MFRTLARRPRVRSVAGATLAVLALALTGFCLVHHPGTDHGTPSHHGQPSGIPDLCTGLVLAAPVVLIAWILRAGRLVASPAARPISLPARPLIPPPEPALAG